MRIEFGWCLDGAAWRPLGATGAVDAVRTGPRGLLGILQTRLGLSHPEVKPALRIGQYLRVLQAVAAEDSGTWFARSLATDPWNTAAHLLELRDSAVEAGWDSAAPLPDTPAAERLRALARVESRVVVGVAEGAIAGGLAVARLAPGYVDDVRAVVAELRALARAGAGWPLGIESIAVVDPIAALPGLWPEILSLVAGLDVAITESLAEGSRASGRVPTLQIVQAPEEWSAAEAAARYLAHSPEPLAGVGVLATGDTVTLDGALAVRGLPTVGHARAGQPSAAAQLLPLALRLTGSGAKSAAGYRMVDVRDLSDLLNFALPGDGVSYLFPSEARRLLGGALDEENGLSKAPGSAWARAFDRLRDLVSEPDEGARKHARLERVLDAATTLDEVLSGALSRGDFLHWLRDRAARLATSRGSDGFAVAAAQFDTFFAVCDCLGVDLDADPRESGRLVADVARAAGADASTPRHPAQAAPWRVLGQAAHVPDGLDTLVWWNAFGTAGGRSGQWDPAEASALAAAGARIVAPRELERLEVDSALRALTSAGRILVFNAERIGDAEQSLDPCLSYLAAELAAGESAAGAGGGPEVEDYLTTVTVQASALVSDGEWALAGASCPVATLSEWIPEPPETLTRTITDGAALLPRHLSYTQAALLIKDPQKWVFQHAMGIKDSTGEIRDQTSRHIGLAVHAVLEALWNTRRVGAVTAGVDGTAGSAVGGTAAIPGRSEINAAFDAAVPRFASELLLDGRGLELADARNRTAEAVVRLYSTLRGAGIRQTGSETPLSFELELPGLPTISFNGFRDFDGIDAHGRPVVVDFKWSSSSTYYRANFEAGLAVQLAVYAHSLENSQLGDDHGHGGGSGGGDSAAGSGGVRAADVVLAYFMLKQAEFISADPKLGSDRAPEDFATLWERTAASIAHTLGQIRSGTLESPTAEAYIRYGADKNAFKERLRVLAETAEAERRIFLNDDFFDRSEYGLVSGLTGDYS